jgi:hypothetical protein
MAAWHKADGTTETVIPSAPDGSLTLKELQGFVGGYIELVRLDDRRLMVVNEDGRSRGLPANAEGTRLYHEMAVRNGHPGGSGGFTIVGNVLVCSLKEMGE